MGYNSQDQITNAITSLNQFWRTDWNKSFLPTTAAVAGEWHCLMRGAGNPPADSIANTGTNLAFQRLYDTTANAGATLHNGNVHPSTKHLLGGSAFTAAATTMPAIAMLVDLLGFYRVTSVTTTTAQTLTNSLGALGTFTADAGTDQITVDNGNLFPFTRVQLTTTGTLPAGLSLATDYYAIKANAAGTVFKLATSYANAVAGTAINITDAGTGTHTLNTVLPRYTSGAGVQAMMWNTNATPLGAATPNLSIGYTNSAQATGRATPATLPVGKTAAANGLILYSGTGLGKFGPAMPLQGGDAGVAKADTVTISASYVSGEFSIGLYRPLAPFPMTTLGVPAERDFVNQLPSLPRIYDGACLTWLLYSAAATPVNSSFYGHLDFGWN